MNKIPRSKRIRIDFEQDCKNQELFNANKWDKSIIYTCLLCGKKSNIFDMVSNKGARMMCTICAKQKYGGYLNAIDKFCKLRD